LRPSVLGLALLAMAVGALLGIPAAGWAAARLGSRAVVRASAFGFFAALALPVLAPSLPLLVAALFVLGASNGALDVSMNAQAAAIEARWPRPIMSAFHGTWSLGGLAGAGAAALALRQGVTPAMHVLGAAALFGGATGVALLALLPPAEDVRGDTRGARRRRARSWASGRSRSSRSWRRSDGDWAPSASSIRSARARARRPSASRPSRSRWRRAASSATRSSRAGQRGARPRDRGTGARVRTALALGHPLAAIAGCAAVGFGLANLIPIVFRAAGAFQRRRERGIAAVGTAGYVGFLAGPPVIGLTAEVATLPGAS
jgi:MFS family permease